MADVTFYDIEFDDVRVATQADIDAMVAGLQRYAGFLRAFDALREARSRAARQGGNFYDLAALIDGWLADG